MFASVCVRAYMHACGAGAAGVDHGRGSWMSCPIPHYHIPLSPSLSRDEEVTATLLFRPCVSALDNRHTHGPAGLSCGFWDTACLMFVYEALFLTDPSLQVMQMRFFINKFYEAAVFPDLSRSQHENWSLEIG